MSLERMFSKIFTGDARVEGGGPQSSSNTTTPSAHQSTSGPYGSQSRISGRGNRACLSRRRAAPPRNHPRRERLSLRRRDEGRSRSPSSSAAAWRSGCSRTSRRRATRRATRARSARRRRCRSRWPRTMRRRPRRFARVLRAAERGAHAESAPETLAGRRGGAPAFTGVPRPRVARDADVGEPEVGELDVPRRGDQQVVRLQVAVDDPARVAVLQREHDLRRVLPAVVLPEAPELPQQRVARRRRRTR